MVSNGFINQEPLEKLLPFMDAFNIDLKAFTEDFYQKITGAKLAPVLETIKTIKKANKHLEITNLIIPGLNDNPKIFEDMVVWIKNNTGKDTVLHLSRYFPRNQLDNEMTPMKTLVDLKIIAEKHLDYVYLGNV